MEKAGLIEAREIFLSAGETHLEELKKRDKVAVFYAMHSDVWRFDGDKYGMYCTVILNKAFPGKFHKHDRIMFVSHADSTYGFDSGLSDLSFEFFDEDRPGQNGEYETRDAVSAIDYILSKIDTTTNVVNLTPHEVVIMDDAGDVTARFPASGQIARVNSYAVDLPPVDGIPVVRTQYGDIDGLPDPQINTIYLVSVVVAQALKQPRPDVFVPDTGPASAVRDVDGKIVGVKRLMQL